MSFAYLTVQVPPPKRTYIITSDVACRTRKSHAVRVIHTDPANARFTLQFRKEIRYEALGKRGAEALTPEPIEHPKGVQGER